MNEQSSPRSLLTLLFCSLLALPAFGQPLPMDLLKEMKARSIGPAGMSGRVTAIAVPAGDPGTIYAGTASGGLWKSTGGGVAWEPVFDTLAVASVGALAIDPLNPSVLWVGTGEGNPRNSQTSGNGIYRSLDGGRSWQHLGLEKTRNIHRVIVHPRNPDVVFVAAIGSAWADTPDRGVYRTTDGGRSWKQVLSVNARTGAADLVIDPHNPNKLIAAMWEYRRWPWYFTSGGKGSGLYVTFDGGETWKRRTGDNGLPAGELGRIGVAIARSRPEVVYALVESKKNALYRSDDGGFSWRKTADENVGNRPFYYAEIYVDPSNENRIYNLHTNVTVSEDGGRTFRTLLRWDIHPDHHAWYVHPDDPDYLIDGNDGGLAISRDRGTTWRFVQNLPLAQYYHINVDSDTPYNVYGGMQDNGSWAGPAYVWRGGGIVNSDWQLLSFGDGFDVVPDRSDERFGYSMSQGGALYRYDRLTVENLQIYPVHPQDSTLRFNWNAGLAHDPFSTTTIYYGSQYLHRSTDRGQSWQIISPDLTTNDTTKQRQLESGGLTYDVTTAENHTSIIAIAPSPLRQGVIWVGTDDGNVQLTTDGGERWRNLRGAIRGVPDSTWVPQIHASSHNAGEAFVVFDNHRRNDWTPYLYHTTNFGQSWNRMVDRDDLWGYVLSFVQDPVEERLMFLGTEFALYVSIDRGGTWTKWTHGYPTVSTMDMVIHPREGDLVIGTFGRAAYVLDDLTPLRVIAREGTGMLSKTLRVFDIPDAYLSFLGRTPGVVAAGDAAFSGENRPFGARISVLANPDTSAGKKDTAVAAASKDSLTIEIFNERGKLVRRLHRKATRGLNRFAWGLERNGVRFPATPKPKPGTPEPGGSLVPPGLYTVRLTMGTAVDSTRVRLAFEPRSSLNQQQLLAYDAYLEQFMEKIRVATEAADRLREATTLASQFEALVTDREGERAAALKKLSTAMRDSLTALSHLITKQEAQGITRAPDIVASRIGSAWGRVNASWGPISPTDSLEVNHAIDILNEVATTINGFFERQWPRYREAVLAAQETFFREFDPLIVPD